MTMDNTDRALQDLKATMTEEQRKDMADLLQAELARREKEKMNKQMPKHKSSVKGSSLNGGLDAEAVGELYSDVEKNVRELRLRKLERELAAAKSQQQRLGKATKNTGMGKLQGVLQKEARLSGATRAPISPKNLALLATIVGLAILKVVFSTGAAGTTKLETAKPVESNLKLPQLEIATSEEPAKPAAEAILAEMPNRAGLAQMKSTSWSDSDKQLLGELDARRVELEQRKSMLERREAEVDKQSKILAERMAELNGLTAKLGDLRKDKDTRYEARLEQLANVYGSMAPNEAAPLIGKLENDVALSLLQRMPEKRMGQILGLMQAERAIELTRHLTDHSKL